MPIDFDVSEYVNETLEIAEEPLSDKEMAESIADIAMSQGHCEGMTFEQVVAELEPQISYYR